MSEPPPGVTGADLIVSVGGTTVVATDVVLAQAQVLRGAQAQAAHWQTRVNSIRELNPDGPHRLNPNDSGLTLLWAWVALGQLEESSGDLAASLTLAAERYGATERVVLRLALLGSAKIGHGLGRFPILALLAAAGPAARGALAWRAWNSHADTHSQLDERLLTNPAVVRLARLLVSSLDDVGEGALGVPFLVGSFLGDGGLGLIGVSSTALAVLAVARSQGLFREGPVSVMPVGAPHPALPPTGAGDLAARIPTAVAGRPQVRIESYGTAEHPSWGVYVGGTVDWNAVAANEPWDLTANVAGMAGQNAGSFEAVMHSMRAAGIGGDDPVVITGHSQGGLVATQVAASGEFAVRAVATFGAPESQVPVPPNIATLTVEHTDDVVTALGGSSLVDSDDRVTVRREAFASVPVPAGERVPAHHLDRYRETALLIDGSPELHLQHFRDTVVGVLGSAPGEARLWRGIRIPEGPPPQ